jgi:anhydro-N-acetylmuramic acid kinase
MTSIDRFSGKIPTFNQKSKPMRVVGLMSGTSVDGIDAALVDISGVDTDIQCELIDRATYPYPAAVRAKILDVCSGQAIAMADLAELDDAIATSFATAAIEIQGTGDRATLIGSHGQTIFHRPATAERMGYSSQIGRGELIAKLTNTTTIANFRAADIAAGGQGAPLVPKIDATLLAHPTLHRCIQNIGGIGNVAYLPPRSQPDWLERVCGWDTGPGNSTIDIAVSQLSGGELTFDRDGAWAATGKVYQPLVEQWLQHPYFLMPPPKSTGRELFGWDYLQTCMTAATAANLAPADILATLTDFTAASIADSYRRFLPHPPEQVLLCGGGCRNNFLRHRLQHHIPTAEIITTDDVGLNGDAKEAIAFAILAYWRYHDTPGNLPHVTGAPRPLLLGEIHQPPVGN